VILENNQPGTAFSGFNKNPWSLAGTRTIVTGAGRGIGATVLGVACSREDLERLREVNPSAGDRLHVFSADLTDASQRGLVGVHFKTGADLDAPAVIKYRGAHLHPLFLVISTSDREPISR
jgi:hypothetical protein